VVVVVVVAADLAVTEVLVVTQAIPELPEAVAEAVGHRFLLLVEILFL
jgi:hypothetical protein